MRVQPSIQPFEQRMPDMPKGVVPITGRTQKADIAVTDKSVNPLPATAENMKAGRIYYGYYCVMCHGMDGDGNGPVGQAYAPKPADLRSVKLSDGEYYQKMLTGTGHSPVMEQTVLPEHRWALVLYAQGLAGSKPSK